MGQEILDNPSMNFSQYLIIPINDMISHTFLGTIQSMMAFILSPSTDIPSLDTMCQRYLILSLSKSHLLNFVYSCCSLGTCKTILKCFLCSCSFLEQISMSLMKTTTNLYRQLLNMLLIKYMNATGAFINPKGIMKKSQRQQQVLNVVLNISSSFIPT